MLLPFFILSSIADKDECSTGTHTCSSKAACTNTEGSYTCDCQLGFKWNPNSKQCKGKQNMCNKLYVIIGCITNI